MRRPTFKETRAIVVLHRIVLGYRPDGAGCCDFGAAYFGGRERVGHVVASQGGGDYAAQMMLGRLRKHGWDETVNTTGSSRWKLTYRGILIAVHWRER